MRGLRQMIRWLGFNSRARRVEEETIYLICPTLEQSKADPDCSLAECSRCKVAVTVGPNSRKALDMGAIIICLQCAVDEDDGTGDLWEFNMAKDL